ncbi:MAG: hypothetical protein GY810_04465 [Aureispira sp.]|nr:hypothetical protein [Aureispira sp.]
MSVHLFGIRHHGPGSAKSLVKALEELKPDILLIESPAEVDEVVQYISNPALIPPVAVLIYNPKDLQQAAYYPYTEFSPEWQALHFAIDSNIPIVSMDLAQSMRLALTEKLLAESQEPEEELKDKDLLAIANDPLGYMAQLAGYEDSERWWEVMFEQHKGDANVFDAIKDLMTALRTELKGQEDYLSLLREAQMRKCIRKAIKDKKQRIAVVCGAWHTPALNVEDYTVKEDNALLKGIPKVKTKATWIPWTYERIATASGYGAGVVSPAWYRLLFFQHEDAVINWMARVAELFRSEDLSASSAHVIEAVRLAETLAVLRGVELPGIDELFEAVVTIFSEGDVSQIELVKNKLIVGERLGEVPADIPIVPLQSDIEAKIKKLKLTKYRKSEALWLKATAQRPKGGLDLRLEHDRKQSQFLHQLNLLDINWGQPERSTGRELTTKNEYWNMQWKPEFALNIIEAGMWGNTVERAATNYAIRRAAEVDSLVGLTELLEKVILAHLPVAIDELVQDLRELAAVTKDINHLMRSLPTLVNILRYGDVRNTELSMIEKLVNEMIPRICIALPSACTSLDDDSSRAMFQQVLIFNRTLTLLHQDVHLETWYRTLQYLSDIDSVSSLIRGIAVRILLDGQIFEVTEVANSMSFALSKGADIQRSAGWIEGFLHGSGLLLIHNPVLWNIVDQWVSSLGSEDFQRLLPVLRRTFSSFPPPEREKMLQLAQNGTVTTALASTSYLNQERVKKVVPMLNLLLGESS